MRIMQAGVRHFLTVPLALEALADTMARVADLCDRTPRKSPDATSVYSFLPAKPGAGTSTIAVNTALHLAAEQPSVLLVDFDLNLGTIGPMLKLSYRNTVVQAAEVAATLNQREWLNLVSSSGRLHVLPSRLNPSAWIEPIQAGHLLNFAQMNYSYVLADHSGNLEKCSLAVLNESRLIFLVVDGDPLSLHLAKQKIEFLRTYELHKRVTVLLNRVRRDNPTSSAAVTTSLGMKPAVIFPHDRERIAQAIRAGAPVDSRSGFAKACSEVAGLIVSREPASERPSRRFLEFFSLAGVAGN
jgi:Flp pilus assembly CpaE family ATPase